MKEKLVLSRGTNWHQAHYRVLQGTGRLEVGRGGRGHTVRRGDLPQPAGPLRHAPDAAQPDPRQAGPRRHAGGGPRVALQPLR